MQYFLKKSEFQDINMQF